MTGVCIKRNKKHSDPCMDHTVRTGIIESRAKAS